MHDVFGGVFSGGGAQIVDGPTRDGGSDAQNYMYRWTIGSARAALVADLQTLDVIALNERAESLLAPWFGKQKNEGADADRIRSEILRRFEKWAHLFWAEDAALGLVVGTVQAICVGKVVFGPLTRVTEADIEMVCDIEPLTARKEAAAGLILHDVFGGVFRAPEPALTLDVEPEPEPGPEPEVRPAAQNHPSWLTVTVMACRDLPRMDMFDKNDAYVSVTCDGQVFRTTTNDGGGADPEWASGDGESLTFELEPRDSGSMTTVSVEVFDEDAGSADDLCGMCRIKLPEAAYVGPYGNSSGLVCAAESNGWKSDEQWFVLENAQKGGSTHTSRRHRSMASRGVSDRLLVLQRELVM